MARRSDTVLLVLVLVVVAGIAATAVSPRQERRLARLEEQIAATTAVPRGVMTLKEIAEVESLVLGAASESGVGITSLEADRLNGGAVVVEYVLHIDAQGHYHDLGAFVSSLESMPWMNRMHGLSLQRRIDGSGTMRVSLRIPMAVGMS